VLFLLAIALADNAFRDYTSADDIFAIRPPSADEDMCELEWKDTTLCVESRTGDCSYSSAVGYFRPGCRNEAE
jgi:hypothetical protein